LDEWFNKCPPEGKEKQWVDTRSAKEMAKFWLDQNSRESFRAFIQQKINGLDYDYIIPEYKSSFDNYGKPRQHDLLIVAKDQKTIITIEGKADETFGTMSFGSNFIDTLNTKLENTNSKALDRMINLYQNYFKCNGNILDIMYQLAYWFAGSLIDTIKHDAQNIVLVLQEFRSESTDDEKLNNNHREFEKFIALMSEGTQKTITNKELIGPIENKYTNGKNLYIGYYSMLLDNYILQ
jgi:hypothetical protein